MNHQFLMNGRPTKPQVDKIIEIVKALPDGGLLTHADLEAVIGEKRTNNRYRTVVNAAIKRCRRELGYRLAAEPRNGYRKPTGQDQVSNGVRRIGRTIRQMGHSVQDIAMVSDDRLPEPRQRDQRDHIISSAMRLHQRAVEERRELSLVVGRGERLPLPSTKAK